MPIERYLIPLDGGGAAHIVATEKADGDFHIDGPPHLLAETRARVVDRPWFWLRQVHGATVVEAVDPRDAGPEADAVVSRSTHLALAVQTADCAPIALVAPVEGWIGAIHAGWRGLAAGVIEATAARLRAAGATDLVGVVGPCISPAHYDFGPTELDAVAGRYGPVVRGVTSGGGPALDLRAGVEAALAAESVDVLAVSERCTAERRSELFSHRDRADTGRQALVVWIDDSAGDER